MTCGEMLLPTMKLNPGSAGAMVEVEPVELPIEP
jgi:hypothetical protein